MNTIYRLFFWFVLTPVALFFVLSAMTVGFLFCTKIGMWVLAGLIICRISRPRRVRARR